MKLYPALLLCLLAQGIFAQSQPPVIRSFQPRHGTTGTTVVIVGRNLGNATKVRFGGVAASSFTVINDSTVKAVVGTGVSGSIVVNNPAGEGVSRETFLFVQPRRR